MRSPFLSLVSAVILLTSTSVIAQESEFPVVDGVIGGVPENVDGARQGTNGTFSVVRLPGQLRVKENHGVCETTPGVYQSSGYGDLTDNQSIFFWHFAARNNPDTAPLSLWFNGGPGSSSMLGLLQSLGPCRITNDTSSVVNNPYSWTTNSNFLFIDQPVGVGFSHGDLLVGTSQQAAADVWKFLQIFFSDARYAKLATRPLGIWTQSYGGHYGPAFAAYFLSQNAKIAAGTLQGITLILQALGVGDGLTDPLLQYPGYMAYAKTNPYHQLVTDAVIARGNTSWNTASTGCKARITNCYNNGSNSVCSGAQSYCNNNVLSPLSGDWNVYYVPNRNPDSYPPSVASYLGSIASTIGAEETWKSNNGVVYNNFASTGDWMRNSRQDLQTVINAGVKTVVWIGDADYILNVPGVEAMVNALETKFAAEYRAKAYSSWTIGGKTAGRFKTAGTFSYVSVFGAGHSVGAYKYGSLAYGQAGFELFNQVLRDGVLSSS